MKRIFVREEACIRCGLREVHCSVEHSKSKDIIKRAQTKTALRRFWTRFPPRTAEEKDAPGEIA